MRGDFTCWGAVRQHGNTGELPVNTWITIKFAAISNLGSRAEARGATADFNSRINDDSKGLDLTHTFLHFWYAEFASYSLARVAPRARAA